MLEFLFRGFFEWIYGLIVDIWGPARAVLMPAMWLYTSTMMFWATVHISFPDESIFGTLTASWLMAIICSVIVMFKVLKLVIEIAERYVILAGCGTGCRRNPAP